MFGPLREGSKTAEHGAPAPEKHGGQAGYKSSVLVQLSPFSHRERRENLFLQAELSSGQSSFLNNPLGSWLPEVTISFFSCPHSTTTMPSDPQECTCAVGARHSHQDTLMGPHISIVGPHLDFPWSTFNRVQSWWNPEPLTCDTFVFYALISAAGKNYWNNRVCVCVCVCAETYWRGNSTGSAFAIIFFKPFFTNSQSAELWGN